MATADQYAEWIVRNKDKKGTKEFETVASAYRLAKEEEAAVVAPSAVSAAPTAEALPPPRREVFTGVGRDVGPAMAMLSPTQKREALALGAGFMAGPALGAVTRAAGVALPAIQRVATPLATAFETGGMQTGLTRTTPAAARVATRVAGGAVPGAITGAIVSPEDAGTGAVIGAGGAFLLPPVAQIVSKGAGYIVDALRGRVATARANQLLRQTIGDEVNALRQAMAAQPDLPASRVAAQLQLPALSALLDKAEQLSPTGVANAFRMRETQDTVNELARLAGGPTAETARAAREKAKESLSGLTGRMREEAFAAARRTGEILPRLSEIASSARESARDAVQRVREFTGMIDSAEEWAKTWVASGGARAAAPRPPGRYTYPGELAGAAERRAGTAAEESLRAGAQARAAENVAQSMRDRGLEPITTNKFTGTIDRMMSDPDIATNPVLVKALPQIRQMFDDWANQHGVITPEAVYAIRKNVGGVIQNLMPTADAKAQSRMAAQVLRKLKPKIDEAIETAGGAGFKNYLDSFERGMSDIRGMELAEQIREWYKSGTKANKQKIVDLLAGESPDVVEDFFGSGRYSIAKEMAKDMPLLERIGTALDLDLKAAAQARLGRKPLADIVESQSAKLRFPFFTRASTAVNEVIEAIEKKVGKETMDQIVKAAQSGRDFNVLLDALPTKERNAFLSQFKNAESWSRFSTQVANAARAYTTAQTAEPAPTNALRP